MSQLTGGGAQACSVSEFLLHFLFGMKVECGADF
jgi:hypothetical protein